MRRPLKIAEVRTGTGVLGTTICTALPAMLLADGGADVTLVALGSPTVELDRALGSLEVWDRSKRTLSGEWSSHAFRRLSIDAVAASDVVLFCGDPDSDLYRVLRARSGAAPWIVVAAGDADLELFVQARSGLTTLMTGPAGGPTYSAVPMAGYGTALAVYTAAFAALLHTRRSGGDVLDFVTDMTDGLSGTQSMLLRTAQYETVSTAPAPLRRFLYECADEEWVHLNLLGPATRTAFFQILQDLGWAPVGAALDPTDDAQAQSIRRFVRRVRSETLLDRLSSARVPAQTAVLPATALQDPEIEDVGLTSRPDAQGRRWIERASLVDSRSNSTGAPTGDLGIAPPSGPLPLAGINVLDCGAYVAGPYSGFVLAQLGARVIKVEAPSGDPARGMPEIFAMCNAGKESIAIDFGEPEAASTVRGLVAWADVVHHNNRSSTAARLGLDPDTCFGVNPTLVHSQITAFGARGSRSDLPGFDQTFQAASGAERLLGGSAGPLWHPSSFCDVAAGWLAAAAVLRGLLEREPGTGVRIETPAIAGGLLALSSLAPSADLRAEPVDDLSGLGPGYGLYRCGDGLWVAIAVLDPARWSALASAVPGLPLEFIPLDRGTAGRRAHTVLAALAESLEATAFERLIRTAGGRAVRAAGSVRAQPLHWHAQSYLERHVDLLGSAHRIGVDDPRAGRVEIATIPGDWRSRAAGHRVVAPGTQLPTIGQDSASVRAELGLG